LPSPDENTGVPGLLRASLYYFNTSEEIDTSIDAVEEFIRKNS
jgi:selenocysteine lyase/cysteine desulfurase